MFNPELKPLQPASPGNALLTIRNWDGSGDNVTLTIQRNQDRNYLNDEGQWVGNAFEHQLSLTPDGENYQISLSKLFVDPLVNNLQMAYRLTLTDDEGNQDIGTLKVHSGVLSSQALGQQESIKSGAVLSGAAPVAQVVPEVVPEIVPEPELEAEPTINLNDIAAEPETPQPVKKKKSPLAAIIAVIVLLAVAGVLVWFFVLKDQTKEAPVEPEQPTQEASPAISTPQEPTTAPATAGVDGACSVENMKTGNALAFVQTCLKSHPNDPSVLSTIEAAVANEQCDVAQRLYAYKAQSGDGKIAFKYAQEYDPAITAKGKCFSADKETAIYWYEIAAKNDPQNAEAKARLDALKK